MAKKMSWKAKKERIYQAAYCGDYQHLRLLGVPEAMAKRLIENPDDPEFRGFLDNGTRY